MRKHPTILYNNVLLAIFRDLEYLNFSDYLETVTSKLKWIY